MNYVAAQQMRKQADAAYESFLSPSQPARPNPTMGTMTTRPQSTPWLYTKAKDTYRYGRDFKEAWPDIKAHPGDAAKSFAKGLSARAADATQGLYDLTVGAPSWLGSQAGTGINWLTYQGLRHLPGQSLSNAANSFNDYRLAYQDAIPYSREQLQKPMDVTVHKLDDAIQDSTALQERELSGKGQEVMRRLGGAAGTLGETALYAGAFGGLGGLKVMAKHPVKAFGSDLAFQYGLGNRQSESLAAGADKTYDRQAADYAYSEAVKSTDAAIQNGRLHPRLRDARIKQLYSVWYPEARELYYSGIQYNN